VDFRVLGPLQVRDADGRPVVPARRKQRVLLVTLLLRGNEPVSTDTLLDGLWDGRPPASAVANLQSYVSDLRRLIGGGRDRLRTVRSGYLLRVTADELDLMRFEKLAEHGRDAMRQGRHATAVEQLGRAAGLWRGPVAEGLPIPEPLRAELDRLEELRLVVQEDWVDARLAVGGHADLVAELAALTRRHPLRERLWAQLMLAQYRSARPAEALATYHAVRELLDRELGAEPGEPLRRLHQQMVTGEATLDPRPGPPVRQGIAPAAPVPHQLPPDVACFTGRTDHIARLRSLLMRTEDGRSGVAGICAVSGTAGVGKTTLAVHWAHGVARRFPDGVLHVNLRGFDPSGPPIAPDEAVRGFLDALGVEPERIPVGLHAQVGLYRSLLAGKRVLILLDDARDAAQVRHLLPGTAGCFAVVTSRDQLVDLVTADGADPLRVDLLTAAEARDLLAARLGARRVAAEPEAVDEVIERCGRLPLALAIVAARAVANPAFPLAALAAELHGNQGELDALGGMGASTDVRTVLSWSYRALSPGAAMLLRLLAVHPGPDVSSPAAASLMGCPTTQVRSLLAELTRASLLAEPVPGRYTMHDLLRAYAAELAGALDSVADRRRVVHRMLDHYLHTAHTASFLLNSHRGRLALEAPQPDVQPEKLTDMTQALAWFTAEHAVLLAVLDVAADRGFDTHAWQLAWTVVTFLKRRMRPHDQIAVHRTALTAARRLGDRTGELVAHRGLGTGYRQLRRYDEATRQFRHALRLLREVGDVTGQARVHLNLAELLDLQQRTEEALDEARTGLRLSETAGDPLTHADALNTVGWYEARLGRHETALALCEESMAIQQRTADRHGEDTTWHSLGYIHRHLGHLEQATACYHRALTLFQEAGDLYNQADTLVHLGDTRLDAGDAYAAEQAWQRAEYILDELGNPKADDARARIAGLRRSNGS
jgi:DNA-binding SARP family transcriptional activator/tetratricopeptide (TPR) repeat protein